jgi:hypothetical protein
MPSCVITEARFLRPPDTGCGADPLLAVSGFGVGDAAVAALVRWIQAKASMATAPAAAAPGPPAGAGSTPTSRGSFSAAGRASGAAGAPPPATPTAAAQAGAAADDEAGWLVDVSGNGLRSGSPAVQELLRCLRAPLAAGPGGGPGARFITELDLGGNAVGGDLAPLAALLRGQRRRGVGGGWLRRLGLRSVGMGDAAGARLAAALATCGSLATLDLGGNYLGEACAQVRPAV